MSLFPFEKSFVTVGSEMCFLALLGVKVGEKCAKSAFLRLRPTVLVPNGMCEMPLRYLFGSVFGSVKEGGLAMGENGTWV